MVKKLKKWSGLFFIFAVILFFYSPLFLSFRLPIPADTIVGLYHPYRDLFSKEYPNGIPFKNFLITDPVRQTYVWKEIVIDTFSKVQLPVWNPYEMAGKPLIANFQTGAFYPLNLLFVLKPFYVSWSLFIISQSLLGGFFMYIYLKNLNLKEPAVILGSLAFTLSGFSVSWLEWGTVVHSALWLPLVLLSIDKLVLTKKFVFSAVIFLSFLFSFFAGHLQVFFYLFIFANAYFLFRWFSHREKRAMLIYTLPVLGFIFLSAIQWIPTLRFILLSARSSDQSFAVTEGWFLPFSHLIQFFAPDFFGNPATLNYWGTWNYGELTGYIGIAGIMFALFALMRRNALVVFLASAIIICLLFALPTGVSSVPFILNIPILSSAQPTRLIFIIVFCLSVLSAIGFSNLLGDRKFSKKHFLGIAILVCVFVLLWGLVIIRPDGLFPDKESLETARRNLLLPTILFVLLSICAWAIIAPKARKLYKTIILFILLIVAFDQLRFAAKFTTFADTNYLFPKTEITEFLTNQKGIFRVSSLDRRIMPPNFFTHYKIQTIEGYDPLYLKNYAEFITLMERGRPDISEPFGFNRIITPRNYESILFDFLNTEYVLSFDELESPNLTKVMEEGSTKLYKNTNAYDRAYFVGEVVNGSNYLEKLMNSDLRRSAYTNEQNGVSINDLSVGEVEIEKYTENEIFIRTTNNGEGFLVISDAFYPSWRAYINGEEVQIIRTNHAFRGIFVPGGEQDILLKSTLF